ncbi:MAG: hypothetical protein Q8P67_01535, partial [archaeon]|nr:hypothetical protein [archaeon]
FFFPQQRNKENKRKKKGFIPKKVGSLFQKKNHAKLQLFISFEYFHIFPPPNPSFCSSSVSSKKQTKQDGIIQSSIRKLDAQ